MGFELVNNATLAGGTHSVITTVRRKGTNHNAIFALKAVGFKGPHHETRIRINNELAAMQTLQQAKHQHRNVIFLEEAVGDLG